MNRQDSTVELWASFKRLLLVVLLLGLLAYLGYQMVLYLQARRFLPADLTMGELAVGGMTLTEARGAVAATYLSPVILFHRDEALELRPADVGFEVNLDAMVSEAESYRTGQEFWQGYLIHMLGFSWKPMAIPLQASHDEERVRQVLQIVADLQDERARGPQILSENSVFQDGQPGFATDVEASLIEVEEALYRPENRMARLVIQDEASPELTFELLEKVIRGQLQQFNGLGIVFVQDLRTGEEITINSDMAISGTSVLKIAIFVEAYRALNAPPNEYVQGLFFDTAALSSNYGANLLLHVVAGEDNTYRGADILTESMRQLGLLNTFMAVPYDAAAPPHRPTTYQTEANSRPDATEDIDPTMQTTAEEIGALLAMIYHCSQGGGALLAVYPELITPTECQEIIDLMVLNEEGNLIRYGVPEGTPVSHKHGWARGTHADAGIVLSTGGDYILVEYLHRPGAWLEAGESFPILREISRAVYNYFNFDDPYLGDPLRDDNLTGEPYPLPLPSGGGNEEPAAADDGDAGGDLPPEPPLAPNEITGE